MQNARRNWRQRKLPSSHLEVRQSSWPALPTSRFHSGAPPEPKPKIHKQVKEDAKQQRSAERVALIAEMAKTMTCREVSQKLGIPQNTLWTMSQRCDFKFVPGVQGGRTKPYTDATEDTRLAERITALRDIGLSRYQVQKQMTICNRTLLRIIKAFDIDFPRAKGKRCDGPI